MILWTKPTKTMTEMMVDVEGPLFIERTDPSLGCKRQNPYYHILSISSKLVWVMMISFPRFSMIHFYGINSSRMILKNCGLHVVYTSAQCEPRFAFRDLLDGRQLLSPSIPSSALPPGSEHLWKKTRQILSNPIRTQLELQKIFQNYPKIIQNHPTSIK